MDITQMLWDIEQIKKLKARYLRFTDTKQWSERRKLFAEKYVFFMGDVTEPTYTSAEEHIANTSKALANAITVHHGHMPESEITSPTTATGIWAMFDYVDFKDEPERSIHGYGHYIEEYEKDTDGNWRFTSMRLTRIRTDLINRPSA